MGVACNPLFPRLQTREDGRSERLSGREAYQLYGDGFRRVMEPNGARVIYSRGARGFLISEGEGEWDAIAFIEYPSAQVMLDMFRDPDYQTVQKHHAAGLVGQVLLFEPFFWVLVIQGLIHDQRKNS